MNWHDYLIEDDNEIRGILRSAKKIAVVGIKDESRKNEAAYMVPEYMKKNGYDIVPVNPKFPSVFGKPCVDSLTELDEPVDAVLFFRRPTNITAHTEELLSMERKPKVVWMQSGIRNMNAAHKLAAAGIKVIQDHCIYRDHLRLIAAH